MLLTAFLSYIAGLLTALAPCVLPLLPVILGGSFNGKSQDKKRPYIITASLVASLILFTILLKASSVLIGVDPKVWSSLSGILVMVLGVFMLFPNAWAQIIGRLGIESKSQGLLGKAFATKNKTWSAVLIGAALGPVFSSCSPTYGWVISTVLPKSAALGVVYLSIYCLGVATSLLAIALLGQKLLKRVKWATNPHGLFQRGIAIIFIIVGLFVFTGWDKKVQTWLVDKDFLNLIQLEKKLVPAKQKVSNAQPTTISTKSDNANQKFFNVAPYNAPEILSSGEWFNSEPLSLDKLKGKVVLIDFWTYSCINCIRTLPYLQGWYDAYKDSGFVVIGVHAPEFAFEKVPKNVGNAIVEKS
jgi:cytochrome c biogenesis protein CcdA